MSNNIKVVKIWADGLWKNNSSLVQLLGLCPLLAVSNTATNAIGLGLATTVVLILTNVSVSLLRFLIPNEIRIPIYVMLIASVVSSVQLLMQAYTFTLYHSLGIFIPLIVTNCIVIGRAEAFASKNNVFHAFMDGFAMGMGSTFALFLLGALREVLGTGTLFVGASSLLGDWANLLEIKLFELDTPFLLAILPPGAFIGLGVLLALKYQIDNVWRVKAKDKQSAQALLDEEDTLVAEVKTK